MYPYYAPEQAEMAEAVSRSFNALEKTSSRAAWDRLTEIGVHLLAVPEEFGGIQANCQTFHAVAEALGRGLQSTAFATSALAATWLVQRMADAPIRSALLDAVSSGRMVIALAATEGNADWSLRPTRTTAVRTEQGWKVSGRKVLSLHSGHATHWIVAASTDKGDVGLFLVDESSPGLQVRRYPTIDNGEAGDLVLDSVSVPVDHCLGTPGQDAAVALRRSVDLAELAACAESVGIQARLLQDTVVFVKERHQFGQALGSFQAVQHRLVDMLVALEQARSLAWLLAIEFDGADADRRAYLVSAAKARCIASGRFIGLQSIHLHGGMGMTDELPVGRGVKRLLAIEHSFGDERYHLGRIAEGIRTSDQYHSQPR